ncbi:Nif3-like dinuclear metal center hexameric protein [bacterium]|nr:Nif3-like dinuclear metal center hexameric protein [candidate division CSSED10-310 bacterium]
MVLRIELEQFLKETFQYDHFQDYCQNGLQIEGKDSIKKIVFGVSFNLLLLEKAIEQQADAIIVHHGFFGKNFFSMKGVLKEKIKLLLHHDISLFGIHLPMDAHEQYGNNARLFSYLGAEICEPYDVGFIGLNIRDYPLGQMLDIFHQKLHAEDYQASPAQQQVTSALIPKQQHGFLYFDNGPAIPETIAIISGGSSKTYRSEEFFEKGVDTFICGSIDEAIPAVSYETKTNFVNIGHYWSEKAGPLALQAEIARLFDVETSFVEIENTI